MKKCTIFCYFDESVMDGGTNRPTDRPTDRETDRRTVPLIEVVSKNNYNVLFCFNDYYDNLTVVFRTSYN